MSWKKKYFSFGLIILRGYVGALGGLKVRSKRKRKKGKKKKEYDELEEGVLSVVVIPCAELPELHLQTKAKATIRRLKLPPGIISKYSIFLKWS